MVRDLVPWRKRKQPTAMAERGAETSLGSLHKQLDSLFEDFFGDFEGLLPMPAHWRSHRGMQVSFPKVEMSETDEAVRVSAELPGMDEKTVDVELDGDLLTIRGEKQEEREEKRKGCLISERSYGAFHRAIQLPAGVDREQAKAEFRKGVLTVTLPKLAAAPASSAKKIKIASE